MSLKPAANAPITCTDWGDLVDEDGFLALGRNRYHCSYVIYTDGVSYFAENGSTGKLDFGGPSGNGGVAGNDAAALFQACINAIPHGLIAIKRGTYSIDTTLTITDKIVSLWAEPGVLLDWVGAGICINIDQNGLTWGQVAVLPPLTLKNFVIQLNTNGQTGIRVHRCKNTVLIEGVTLTCSTDGATTGIDVFGYSALTIIRDCKLTQLHANKVGVGIKFDVDVARPNCSVVQNCRNIDGWNYGIQVMDGYFVTIERNIIQLNNTGIYLEIAYSRIMKNYFENQVNFDVELQYAQIAPRVTWIHDNNFNAPINDPNTVDVLYEENTGYITRNSGVAVMANGTAAIQVAHGLAETPTVFAVVGQDAEVSALYITAVGAANFTINKGTAGNVTANRNIYWEVEVRN